MADQTAFAEFSGDWNPMHMDRLAARRMAPGDVVAHGLHGVLWALEEILAAGIARSLPAELRVQFHKFIHVDREVVLHVGGYADGERLLAELVADGVVGTTLSLTSAETIRPAPDLSWTVKEISLDRTPLRPALSEMAGSSGWLSPSAGAAMAPHLFPALCAQLGEGRVAALSQFSTIVGMVCPGLHSIFSSLTATITEPALDRKGVGWRASVPDQRYPRVQVLTQGAGVTGDIKALIRPEPVAPPAMTALAALVEPDEFQGRRALVIGGSRGLGAVTAKLLGAGGAEVVVTFAAGEREAAAVVDDIRTVRGDGAATKLQFDVLEEPDAQVVAALATATHLYYFPTPHIFRQGDGVFSAAAFAQFTQIYVDSFHQLCLRARQVRGDRGMSILYPSSVAVSERPRGMTEYAMAKAAGEILCGDLARAFPQFSLRAPRLPRTLTDQTASVLPVKSADPVAVLLPLLRGEVAP